MKIFIDSADVSEIKEAYSFGIIDGVTTNPSLIKQAAEKYGTKDMEAYLKDLLAVVGDHPVSLEVKGGTSEEMYEQARKLYDRFKTHSNTVVIKIPISSSLSETDHLDTESLKVIRKLASEGVPTNVTLVFTPEQALLAAKAGATYVSPFVGRLDDYIRRKMGRKFAKNDYFVPDCEDDHCITDDGIHTGLELVEDIVHIFKKYNYKTKVLAASLRNDRQVREAAMIGSDVSTIPFSVIQSLIKHPKTLEGMQKFTEDFVPEYEDLLR